MTIKIRRAVIVEDNVSTRELIHLALTAFDAQEIVEAKDGAEALAALQGKGADIVIMDWMMEVMDGLECSRRIRAGDGGIDPRTPIMLLTGKTGAEAEKSAYQAGVNHFMEKPFSLKKLLAGVTKILGNANS